MPIQQDITTPKPEHFNSRFTLNQATPPDQQFVNEVKQTLGAKEISIWLEPWRIHDRFGTKFYSMATWSDGTEIHEQSSTSFDNARELLYERAVQIFKEPDIMEETQPSERKPATKVTIEIISYFITHQTIDHDFFGLPF